MKNAMERVRKIAQHIDPSAHQLSSSTSAAAAKPFEGTHGGSLVAAALKEQGTTHVFTLTGGHICPMLIGCKQAGISVIDVRDEVTTVFAADAVSRISGQVGVAMVTAGPGLTNTITAVKNAQMAESPVVLFGGATIQLLKGRGSLQDIDQMALMKPHVKWAVSCTNCRDIIGIVRKAFDIAQSGVPGPVFIETPLDVLWPEGMIMEQAGLNDPAPFGFSRKQIFKWIADKYQLRHFNNVFHNTMKKYPPLKPNVQYPNSVSDYVMRRIAGKVMSAKRPVLILGSQTALRYERMKELQRAVEQLNIPVWLSGMCRGLMGRNHRLHMKHKRGDACKRADLVIMAGAAQDFRLDYGRIFGGRSYLVHVNLDAAALKRNSDLRGRDESIQADPCGFIIDLALRVKADPTRYLPWMEENNERQLKREQWIDKTAEEGASMPGGKFVHPVRACRIIEECMGENAIIIGDGGDFVGTCSYTVQPRGALGWLDPGAFGTLGCGGGFALGVKATRPDAEVWIMYGDGACGWSIMEVDSMVRHGLPVILVIGNDACWSQMYRDQVKVFDDAVATELSYTHYEKVCEGFGGAGILVESEEQLKPALMRAREIARGGTAVCVNVLISKSTFREGSISL